MHIVTLPDGSPCIAEWHRYPDGSPALQLVDAATGAPVMRPTAPSGDPQRVVIKDYTEYAGVYDALVAAGVLTATTESAPLGYATGRVGYRTA